MTLPAWEDTVEGPPLQALQRRLADCPEVFLAADIDSAAVVSDLLLEHRGMPLSDAEATTLRERNNRQSVIMVAAWLLADPVWMRLQAAARVKSLLLGGLDELARHTTAAALVNDPDRREELVRLAMRAVGWRPAGESVHQAQDRLTTMSSAERARVIREARAAEERARKLREEMARRAAEAQAATWGNE